MEEDGKTLEQQIAEITQTKDARISELETEKAALQAKLKERDQVISKFLTSPGTKPAADTYEQEDHTDDVKDILNIIKRRRS